MRRYSPLLAATLLAACAGSPPGIPDPIGYETPVPGASVAASAAPSAAASAGPVGTTAPSVAPSASVGAHLGLLGVGSAHGRSAVRWAIALADATTGEALRVRTTLPTAIPNGNQVAFLPEGRTDSDGRFRVWIENPRPGLVVRVTLTSPDETQVITAIAPEADLGPLDPAPPASAPPATLVTPAPAATTLELATGWRLLQASASPPASPSAAPSSPPERSAAPAGGPPYAPLALTLTIDESSSAQAALLRGPLLALRVLPPEAVRPLLRPLFADVRALAKPLAAAVDLKPALADTPITRAGQPGDGHGQALTTWLEAAERAVEARTLVAGAIADLALALAAAKPPTTTVLPETPLWGTPLTIRRGVSDAAAIVRSTKTGQDLPQLTRAALLEAAGGGTVAGPTTGGGQAVTVRFAAMAGDRSLTTSGPTGDADSPTYFSFGQDGRKVRPIDLRFYVHDLVLLGADGRLAPLKLAENGWQHEATALIDLDAGTTPEFNNQITGTVPAGTYTGLRFKLGLPEDLVNADRTVGGGKRSPHLILAWDGHAAGMGGAPLQGRRFMKLELGIVPDAGKEKRLAFHLGGTDPSNPADPNDSDFDPAETTYAAPNVVTVRLNDFNPLADTVVADVQALFQGVTLASGGEYFPVTDEPGAAGGVPASEVNLPTGHALLRNLGLSGSAEQKLFRKAK